MRRYLALFSCHDFRTEPGVFAPTRQALHRFLLDLREKFPGGSVAVHISDKRALGVGVAVAALEEPGLGRRLLEIWDQLVSGDIEGGGLELLGRFFPLPGYLSSLTVTLEGRVYVVYNLPERGEVRDKILASIEGLVSKYGGWWSKGFTVPVRNCTEGLGFEEWRVEQYIKTFRKLLKGPSYRSKGSILLDLVIVAALDWNPWLTLQELESLVHLFEARLLGHSRFLGVEPPEGLRLRRRRLSRHYRSLSEAGIVGRVRLRGLLGPVVTSVFHAPSECGERLYALAAGCLGTSSVAVLEEGVVMALGLPESFRVEALRALEGCRGVAARSSVAGLVAPFPFEYYDPFDDVWVEEPVDVVKALYRFELLEDRLPRPQRPGRRRKRRGDTGSG